MSPPIGKALAFDAACDVRNALCIGPAKSGAAIVAKIELREIAVQMRLASIAKACHLMTREWVKSLN